MKKNTIQDKVGFSTLEIFNEAQGFNQWMYSKIGKYIGNCVLEIGSGIGNLTKLIISNQIYASDISLEYVNILKEKFGNMKNIYPLQLDIVNFDKNVFDAEIDTIVCLNVLEHIEDDKKALKNMYNILSSNGTLIILVPFSNLLYSNLDYLLGHFRRYSKKTLNNVIQSNGFEVHKIFYFNFFGGIGWFISGKIFKKQELSKKSIGAFEKLVPFFKIFESMGVPFGASLICIAQKTN